VRDRKTGRGGRRSGRGGAPWWCGTHCRNGGVGEQPEEAATSGVLKEEDNDMGTAVARLR
jgi:hypothetical protein